MPMLIAGLGGELQGTKMKNRPITLVDDDTRIHSTTRRCKQFKLNRAGDGQSPAKGCATMNRSQYFLSLLLAALTGIWLLYLVLGDNR